MPPPHSIFRIRRGPNHEFMAGEWRERYSHRATSQRIEVANRANLFFHLDSRFKRSVIAGHGTLTSATSVAYPTSFCYRVYINSYLADAWVPKNCLAMICMRPLSFVPSMAARHSLGNFHMDLSFHLAVVQRLLRV